MAACSGDTNFGVVVGRLLRFMWRDGRIRLIGAAIGGRTGGSMVGSNAEYWDDLGEIVGIGDQPLPDFLP